MTLPLAADACSRFEDLFGERPRYVVQAPGRVNLIGEHTDYNDGFVFPAAIERQIVIAAAPRRDRQVRAFSLNFNASSTFSLDDIEPAERGERWANYMRGMAATLQADGTVLAGMNCVLVGNVPLASGLSSSAAMLVASGLAIAAASGVVCAGRELALAAQRAEREFVGVNVGIMDMFISALGVANHALFIDTRSLEYEAVPLPDSGVSIVIADTNKKRGLVDSEYNARRAECERAVELIAQAVPGVRALRDVTPAQVEAAREALGDVVYRRARHVVTEDGRTLAGVAALRAGDMVEFGRLMNASHESLRTDYEVSCSELDAIVAAMRAVEGVYGARMTGAGFGGCAVALVADEALPEFRERVPEAYHAATGMNATLLVTRAAAGAGLLPRPD